MAPITASSRGDEGEGEKARSGRVGIGRRKWTWPRMRFGLRFVYQLEAVEGWHFQTSRLQHRVAEPESEEGAF